MPSAKSTRCPGESGLQVIHEPIIPVRFIGPIRTYLIRGLLDTGASMTLLPPVLLDQARPGAGRSSSISNRGGGTRCLAWRTRSGAALGTNDLPLVHPGRLHPPGRQHRPARARGLPRPLLGNVRRPSQARHASPQRHVPRPGDRGCLSRPDPSPGVVRESGRYRVTRRFPRRRTEIGRNAERGTRKGDTINIGNCLSIPPTGPTASPVPARWAPAAGRAVVLDPCSSVSVRG